MTDQSDPTPEPAPNGAPALNQLYFYLTAGCNLACRHCWLAPKFDPRAARFPVLALEHFETAIREARPLGLSTVKLTGGEPLLHPHFSTLLALIRRQRLALVLETNGILCTLELAREIARSPGCFVSTSLDGANAETHDWVRGIRGAFDRTIQGVKNLVDAGVRPQIIMSLMRRNVSQVAAMVRLAEELGASSLKFNVIQPTGRGEKIARGAQGLEVAELIRLGRRVDTELAGVSDIKLYFDVPMAFRPMSRIAAEKERGSCGILGILGVIPTGHYALCGIGEHLPELQFGRIGQDPLSQVWRTNPVLNQLRSSLPRQLAGICASCLMKYQCLGSCVAQNFYRTGDLLAPFWFCEQAAAAGLFPVSRLANEDFPNLHEQTREEVVK